MPQELRKIGKTHQDDTESDYIRQRRIRVKETGYNDGEEGAQHGSNDKNLKFIHRYSYIRRSK